ncbi:MAG: histidine kinase dimerization/phospho-acceptor domain-containing protein, partial [Candidatus Aenigmatarchaeota archaeon]
MYKVFKVSSRKFTSFNSSEKAISALWRIDKIILKTTNMKVLTDKVVNVMLEELNYLDLGYRIIVLSLVNREKKVLERTSISKTEFARLALSNSPVRFRDLVFSLNQTNNLSIKALKDRKPYITNNLHDMLFPAVDKKVVHFVQRKLGILSSIVFPIYSKDLPLGTLIFSLSKPESKMLEFEKQILVGFTNVVGIAIEHARLIKNLKDTNQKLKNLDKQKDEFLNMAAHELRAPMTAIKGYISMIIEGDAGEIPEKARKYLADANAVTDRLVRLVNNML